MITEGIGFAHRRLIANIVETHWKSNAEKKVYTYNELLFILNAILIEQGKPYFEGRFGIQAGYQNFRMFVQHLLYRNIANYDSMVLITAEKGCITDDSLIEMPRDLIKYPKGIPVKDLINKGPIYVYSFNNKTKKIELKQSDGVEWAKYDDVYELELTNGQTIKATKDHPFMLMDGSYKQLQDLIYLDKIKNISNIHNYNRYVKKGETKWSYTDRLRVFFRPDNIKNEFIKIDYNKIDRKNGDKGINHCMIESRFICEQIYSNVGKNYVHHLDKNHYNNTIENLKVVNYHEHNNIHNFYDRQFKPGNNYGSLNKGSTFKKGKIKIKKGTKEYCQFMREAKIAFYINPLNKEKVENFKQKRQSINSIRSKLQTGGIIKSIKYIGKQNVYDVVNVKDNHNFIANGFIVSNTGKSSAAIMLAREWCKLLGIRFNPARHIAYNNSDVSSKIDLLNKFEPVIADEAIRFACITGDTVIKTINGLIPIKKLVNKQNFKVYSYNEQTKKEEIQVAKKCIKTKIDYVYEIETEDGKKIKATKEHKFLTRNGWKELQQLKEGDEIVGI